MFSIKRGEDMKDKSGRKMHYYHPTFDASYCTRCTNKNFLTHNIDKVTCILCKNKIEKALQG